MPPTKFEQFFVTFLLSTPSDLHNLWINDPDNNEAIAQFLSSINFTNVAYVQQVMGLLSPFKDSFQAAAAGLQDVPALPYPPGTAHPTGEEARDFLVKIRQ